MTRRRILFVSSTTEGGSGRSQRALYRHLAARGVDVTLLVDDGRPRAITRRIAERLADASVRFPRIAPIRLLESQPGRRPATTTIEDTEMATSIAPHNAARRLLDDWRPDVVVGSSIDRYAWRRIRERCDEIGIPTVLYIREESALGHLRVEPDHTAVIANARSLADAADTAAPANRPCVFIPSVIDTAPTRTESTRRVALLVNPIESHGVDRVWDLADRLPDISFVLQESWELSEQQLANVQAHIATRPNVELRRRQPPGPALYRDARVLLAPHRIDNRPRVIAEAHANGIPALVNDHGGLRETVGAAGVVLADEADAWASAVEELFVDDGEYERLCDAARQHSRRAETDPALVVDRFEETIETILDNQSKTPHASHARTGVTTSPETHGVLVTFRRLDELREHLQRLTDQTRPLSTLTVIDNDADPAVEELVAGSLGQAAATGIVRYLPAPGNPGPAGGFSLGIEAVLRQQPAASDVVVLLDDNDPPRTNDVFADSLAVLHDLQADHADVGGVGSWGAVLGSRGRLRMATDSTPAVVDYLAGGACPHYTVSALRAAGGGPDPDLFFGFEELDLGRAIGRAGFRIWSSGLAHEHGWGEKMTRTRASISVTDPTWRRYYSVRNLITVLRKDGRPFDAAFVSITAGIAKPLLNLVRRPSAAWATLRLTGPAVLHAWTGRLGRRVEPA